VRERNEQKWRGEGGGMRESGGYEREVMGNAGIWFDDKTSNDRTYNDKHIKTKRITTKRLEGRTYSDKTSNVT
jgi:hypothetical protein